MKGCNIIVSLDRSQSRRKSVQVSFLEFVDTCYLRSCIALLYHDISNGWIQTTTLALSLERRLNTTTVKAYEFLFNVLL